MKQISGNQERKQQRGNKTGCEALVVFFLFPHLSARLKPGELLPSLLMVSEVGPTVRACSSTAAEMS